jgi:hypothetical protein
VICITKRISFRRHNDHSQASGIGMKQAREFQVALCIFMNPKAWTIRL